MAKDKNINIRCSAEEKEMIEKLAAEQGRSVSNYLIRLATEDAKRSDEG